VAPTLLPQALVEALSARQVFRGRGLTGASLRAYRNAYLSRLHLVPPEIELRDALVVDIGANEGNFATAVLNVAPTARVFAVEPGPDTVARLQARFNGDARVTIVPKALAERSGTATLHITGNDHNVSLHRPRENMRELYEDEGWRLVGLMDVATTTLDDLVGDADVALIKLDVQGAERDVIRGGERTLARTWAVLMEVTFVSHYEGDATFQVLNQEMLERGFELYAMSSPSGTRGGRITWADACYVRT